MRGHPGHGRGVHFIAVLQDLASSLQAPIEPSGAAHIGSRASLGSAHTYVFLMFARRLRRACRLDVLEDRAEVDPRAAPCMRIAVGEYRGRSAVRAELAVRLRR